MCLEFSPHYTENLKCTSKSAKFLHNHLTSLTNICATKIFELIRVVHYNIGISYDVRSFHNQYYEKNDDSLLPKLLGK